MQDKDNPSNSVDSKGVQEVFASVNYYKDLEDYKGVDFKTAVITNAVDYTSNAKKNSRAKRRLSNRQRRIERDVGSASFA